MRKHLFYLPLEPYEERYTKQLSSPSGWFERQAEACGVEFTRIDGYLGEQEIPKEIVVGKVVDAMGRSLWAMRQMQGLLPLIQNGDIVYVEDFWHPGLESIPYYCQMADIKVKVYARCWAQTVEPHDFTYEMREWMRHYERGQGQWLAGIFVAARAHRDMLIMHQIASKRKIHVIGLPFDSSAVLDRFRCDTEVPDSRTCITPREDRPPRVIFSSRWDAEKQPKIYLEIAKRMHERYPDENIEFIATTSRSTHSEGWKKMLEDCTMGGDHVIPIRVDKRGYYDYLRQSRVQFNCALLDFVSFTLLEACTFDCLPVYPSYCSFPDEFSRIEYGHAHLYDPFDLDDAVKKILNGLHDSISHYQPIPKYHDETHKRMFDIIFRECCQCA